MFDLLLHCHIFIVGNLIAVYTPKKEIAAGEITSGGRYVVLSVGGHPELVTLQLCGPGVDSTDVNEVYGAPENSGKVFELKEKDIC